MDIRLKASLKVLTILTIASTWSWTVSRPSYDDQLVHAVFDKVVKRGWYSELDQSRERTVLIRLINHEVPKKFYVYANDSIVPYKVEDINFTSDYELDLSQHKPDTSGILKYSLRLDKKWSGYEATFEAGQRGDSAVIQRFRMILSWIE